MSQKGIYKNTIYGGGKTFLVVVNVKYYRIQALIEELVDDWDDLNLAAKILVYLGFFLIFATIFISIYESKNMELYTTIEVIFRTTLASVFGFLLSSNTKSSNDKGKNKLLEKMMISVEKEDAITQELQIKKEKHHYYYGEGNSVQIIVALLISLISALIMLVSYTFGFVNNVAIIGQFRDLMCTSTGFLLGEAKIKNKN